MTTAVPDTLLLPVETLNREFDGKLLLGLFALERGWKPIIGGRAIMHAELLSFPPSVYFAKGARSGSQEIFAQLAGLGHRIVAADEEALVRSSDELFLLKLDPDTLKHVRVLFAWGEDNAELWRRSAHYAGTPIDCAGNPRVDVMRRELRGYHAPEIESIRRRMGDFALLNSNFSVVNHFIPNKTRFKVADWVSAEQRESMKTGLLDHRRALFERFLEIVPRLARALAPLTLVIRPHPSENAAAWQAAARGLPNVQVLHEGPVVPWLVAARVLLHNGCTSAVEAAVIGTPALAFRPVTSDEFDIRLPNALSLECFDEATLLAKLQAVARGASLGMTEAQRAVLRHHVSGLDGPFCCERILDGLAAHRDRLADGSAAGGRSRMEAILRHRKRWLPKRIIAAIRGPSRQDRYLAHKFPGLPQEHIDDRIGRLQRVLGRFEGVRARRVKPDIYALQRS